MSDIEILCFFIPIKRGLHSSYTPNSIDIVIVLIDIFPIAMISDSNAVLLLILGQFLLLSYFILSCHKIMLKVSDSILYYSITFYVIMLIQLTVMFFLAAIGITVNSPAISITSNLITLIFTSLIYLFTPICKLYNLLLHSSIFIKLILIDIYFIFTSIALIFKMDFPTTYRNFAIIMGVYIIIFVSSSGMIYYEKNLELASQSIDSYKKNITIYESLLHEIRASQHEYDNRIATIKSLVSSESFNQETYEKLKLYVSDYSSHSDIYPLIRINMPLLAASLYNLHLKAANQGIQIIYTIPSYKLYSTVPEYQITDFICILVQNAIEASNKDSYICIKMINRESVLCIEVRNRSNTYYTKEQLHNMLYNYKGNSSKEDEKRDGIAHGYGLFHLRKTLRKFDSVIEADCIYFDGYNWIIFRLLL